MWIHTFFSGKPAKHPDHPDYIPSVFDFTPGRQTTPLRISRYQRLCKRRLALTPIAEENRENLAARDEAAFALIELGASAARTTDTGTIFVQ